MFFERLKDEIREGRSPRSAVPRAWLRARRTILSADAVSFLAAAILYYLAAGTVKGFAFTLGLSTVLDLVIVFLFTHPVVTVFARNKAFMSPRFSGLGCVATARSPAPRPSGPNSPSAGRRRRTRPPHDPLLHLPREQPCSGSRPSGPPRRARRRRRRRPALPEQCRQRGRHGRVAGEGPEQC